MSLSNLPLFQFTLDWNNLQHNFTEVLNFAEIKDTLKRSENWHGVFYKFIEELQLINEAATFVQTAYDTHGVEAEVTLTVLVNQDNIGTYTQIYSGLLDLLKIKFLDYDKDRPELSSALSNPTVVSVPLLSDQLDTDKLNSRSKNKTGLQDTLTLDNEVTTPATLINILTHSKAIPLLGRLEPQTPLYLDQVSEASPRIRNILTVSDIQYNEDNAVSSSPPPTFTAPADDTYEFTITGTIQADYETTANVLYLLKYQKNADPDVILNSETFATPSGSETITLNISFQLALLTNDTVNIFFENDLPNNLTDFLDLTYNVTSEIVRFSVDSDTDNDGILVFEALQKSLENMTSNTNPLNSDFFGRTDTTPSYAADGTGSLLAITNGFFLRKAVNPNDIIFSFDEIYKALNTLFPIGLSYESGQFRIEERSYFYDTSAPVIATFENIPNIDIEPATDYYFNKFLYGYDKAETESVKLNDEFCTEAEASTQHKIVDNTAELRSPFIASGYAIELQRRQRTNPEGGAYDSDNFYFAVIRSGGGGFESEKDVAFTSVTGVISPETSYNLRYSPARNLDRHKAFLAASFYNCLFQQISPKFSKGNFELETDLGGNVIKESDSQTLLDTDRLFIPEQITFEAPVSIELWLTIKANPTNKIKVSAGEQRYFEGFILEVNYTFDKGICNFTLLRYS